MTMTILSVLLAVLGFTADRITKIRARRPIKNSGFAMNRLEERRGLVVGVSVAVFIMICAIYAAVLIKPGRSVLKIGLGIVMGGAAGNVYDRVVHREVVDFIRVSFLKKIVFNVADVLLVVGTLVSIFGELTEN